MISELLYLWTQINVYT